MKRQERAVATRTKDDEAAYLAECARLYEVWREVCAEVLAETPSEELGFGASNIAAAEMQI